MTTKSDRVFYVRIQKGWFMAIAWLSQFLMVSVGFGIMILSAAFLTGCTLEASFTTLSLSSETQMKLTLLDPPTSPAADSQPTLRINGTKKNTLVKIFSDNICTQQLASVVATGKYVDITTPVLAEGENQFYVKIQDDSSGTMSKMESECFNSEITYTYEKLFWKPQAFVKASNADTDDMLGFNMFGLEMFGISSLAIDGDTMAVASIMESSAQTTITNGESASNANDQAGTGAVYIFKRSGVNWEQQAYIKPRISNEEFYFGIGLDLSGDTLAVGTYGDSTTNTTITNGEDTSLDWSMLGPEATGSVFIYKRSGEKWRHQAYIKPANNVKVVGVDLLGFGLSLSLDQDTLAVGALGDSSTQTSITNGSTVTVVNDVSKKGSGAVYIYSRVGETWSQQAYLKASNAEAEDYFGSSVSLSGDRLAVSAMGEDANLKNINNSGIASADNTLENSGAVYIFKRTGTSWSQEAYLKAANSTEGMYYGYSLSLSGNTLAVSALFEGSLHQNIINGEGADTDNSFPGRGAVYVYRFDGGLWSQEAYIKPSNLHSYYFGNSVNLHGDLLSVGSPADMYNYSGVQNGSTGNGISETEYAGDSKEFAGGVYLYRRANKLWTQEAYIKEHIPKKDMYFGMTTSVSKNTLAVIAPMESSGLRSIINGPGAGTDQDSPQSGAVYIYTRNEAIASINKGTPQKLAASNNFVMQIGGSDIVAYRYKAGPAGSTNCSDLTGYSETISASTALNLNLSGYADGEMVLCLLGETSSGQKQLVANASSYRWFKDSSAPTKPTNVIDGVIEWGDLTTTPLIQWNAGTDNSGVVTYEVSLGTTAGATDLMAWKSVGSGTTWSGNGLSFINGSKVFVNVRSVDNVGNRSAVGSSDGYLVNFVGWLQQAYVKAINGDIDDYFGVAVDISGDTLVVGAPLEDSNQTTITEDGSASSNNSAVNSGAVYVYTRTAGNWSQQAYIKAGNAEAGDNFGASVSIDGDTLVVGAIAEDSGSTTITNGTSSDLTNGKSLSGAVYVYKRTGTGWQQQAYIKASNSTTNVNFGVFVDIDGDTLVVGAQGESSNSTGITNGSGSPNGDFSLTGSGAVYVYKRLGTDWHQEAFIKAGNASSGDQFAPLSLDGDTLAVGAPFEDTQYTQIINGAGLPPENADTSDSGAVYVYKRSGSSWHQEAYIKAINSIQDHGFGYRVSLSGDTLAVSSADKSSQNFITNGPTASNDTSFSSAGAVYIYKRTGANWAQEAYIKPSNMDSLDQFVFISLKGDLLAVGAPGEASAQTTISNNSALASSDNSLANSGAVYIFKRQGNEWAQISYIKASNAGQDELFGYDVSLDGSTLVVAAVYEKSNHRGIINGQGAAGTKGPDDYGAVYIYKLHE